MDFNIESYETMYGKLLTCCSNSKPTIILLSAEHEPYIIECYSCKNCSKRRDTIEEAFIDWNNKPFTREKLLDAIYNCEEYYADSTLERDYVEESLRMLEILKNQGIADISQRDVMTIWYDYSNGLSASWISFPDRPIDEEFFIRVCLAFIEKYS